MKYSIIAKLSSYSLIVKSSNLDIIFQTYSICTYNLTRILSQSLTLTTIPTIHNDYSLLWINII